MKKIITTALILLMSLCSFSQTMYKSYSVIAIDSNISVPRYLVGYNDNAKPDTLGIVLTIKQAQKIDNDLELLTLYKNMHTDCDSSVNFLVQVVDDYKHLNVLAQDKFKEYDLAIIDQKNQIDNLKLQMNIKESQLSLKDGIIKDKDDVISIDHKQIVHLQKQKAVLIIGGGTVVVGLIYMLLGHPGIK